MLDDVIERHVQFVSNFNHTVEPTVDFLHTSHPPDSRAPLEHKRNIKAGELVGIAKYCATRRAEQDVVVV